MDSGGQLTTGRGKGPMTQAGAVERPARSSDRAFKWVAALVAACLVGFVVFVVVRGSTHPAAVGSAALESPPPPVLKGGTVAPGFSLPALHGGVPVSLAAFRGTPVIVNFFASWCPDCRQELGAMAAVARDHAGHLAVIGVDSNETSAAAASALLAAAGASYPVGVDPHAAVGDPVPRGGASRQLLRRFLRQGGRCRPRAADGALARALDGAPRSAGRMSGPNETDVDNPSAEADGDQRRPPASSLPVDRAAALAEGAPGIPAKFVVWTLGIALVVSLGGLVGEHLFSGAGLNPVPQPSGPTSTTVPVATPSIPTPNQSVNSSLTSFMGLSTPTLKPASRFTLSDQNGRPTTVPAPSSQVVVLTFFNAPCNDICPVEAAEIVQADADLGAVAPRVEFVTVNTDPTAVGQPAEAPVLSTTGLGALPNWHMVTGPLTTLNAIWKAYGVSISVDKKTGLEAHNDVMAFIDPHGALRYRATPFADESRTGTFSLPPASIARWAQGIATYATRLAGS